MLFVNCENTCDVFLYFSIVIISVVQWTQSEFPLKIWAFE